MALFGDTKSQQKTYTTVTDRRVAASGGSIVAGEKGKVTIKSLDPKTVSESLGLARFAISEATRGAEKVAAGFTEATTASRQREQDLLAAAIAPDAAGGANLLNTLVIVAAIAAGAFVLLSWGGR